MFFGVGGQGRAALQLHLGAGRRSLWVRVQPPQPFGQGVIRRQTLGFSMPPRLAALPARRSERNEDGSASNPDAVELVAELGRLNLDLHDYDQLLLWLTLMVRYLPPNRLPPGVCVETAVLSVALQSAAAVNEYRDCVQTMTTTGHFKEDAAPSRALWMATTLVRALGLGSEPRALLCVGRGARFWPHGLGPMQADPHTPVMP
jgi:hypothetical protein